MKKGWKNAVKILLGNINKIVCLVMVKVMMMSMVKVFNNYIKNLIKSYYSCNNPLKVNIYHNTTTNYHNYSFPNF